MSRENRAVREATRAVNEALRDNYAQAAFEIVRFGRHRDGYLHAQVTLSGLPIYVYRRAGSWQIPRSPQEPSCPVQFEGRCVLKDVLAPYSFTLANEARRFEFAERRQQEKIDATRTPPDQQTSIAGRGPAAEAA